MTPLAVAQQTRRTCAGGRVRSPGSPLDVSAPGSEAADAVTATLFDDPGEEPTLDELVSGVWEGLVAHQLVPCPWCGGEMTPVYSAHARPIAGGCGNCETTLS